MSRPELDGLLGMRLGEPARWDRIRAGLDAVKEACKDRGFLDVKIAGAPELHAGEPRAAWKLSIEEGPRYSMGALIITGLPEEKARPAKVEWRLAEGAPYEGSYPERFVKEVLLSAKYLSRGDSIRFAVKPDHDRHVVDVAIEVTHGVSEPR